MAEALGDEIRVDALVAEFLAAQSLKILPQRPFGDAVSQFVNKDDKHAMETFVSESLAGQVKDLLALNPEENDLDAAMEEWRKRREAQFSAGLLKANRRRVVKPKPDEWDSDLDGHWEDQPGVVEYLQTRPPSPPTKPRPVARGRSTRVVDEGSDEDLFVDNEESVPPVLAAKRGAAIKAAPTRKTAAAKKAPPRGGRGKKTANPFVEDEEDGEGEDDFMDVDEQATKPPLKRPPRAAAARSTRQTTLDFPQSQKKGTQKALEISDDEISEEEEEDNAFESLPTTTKTRRR